MFCAVSNFESFPDKFIFENIANKEGNYNVILMTVNTRFFKEMFMLQTWCIG